MKVLYERVAGIDVHKDMVKVAIRSPGEKPWTRKTEILEFRTFYGVLQEMARELRRRGVTHVVMEASGVYTEPVYYALREQDFTQVAVINPAHAKALKGHKTDAKDCARLAELFECGLLRGSYIPSAEQKEVRDLTRYRMKTVQARTSEIQRLGKSLESAGIKLGSVASDITGKSATAMIESLIDGERRGQVLADLAIGRMRTAGKLADLSMALAGRFTDHHALMCRLNLDRIKVLDEAVGGLNGRIAAGAARWQREADLLTTVPGFGDVVTWAWLAEIGPAPHQWFASHEKLASWVTLCPGNNISARKRKHGRTGDAGTYIKPMLIQAAWAAIRVRGRLQARYNRLVRRFGGDKNPGAKKKAITAIAHTLLKIAYQVLKSGTPYQEPGADFYTRRESPAQRQAYLERQLQKLHPGYTITITISPPGEVPLQQVRGPLMPGPGALHGGPRRLAPPHPLQAVLAHQPLHRAPRDPDAAPVQLQPGLPGPVHLLVAGLAQPEDLGEDLRVPHAARRRRPLHGRIIGARGDLPAVLAEHPADRLDPEPFLLLADEPHERPSGRSSSAAKKADAAFRISFARRSSATSRFSVLICSFSPVVIPGRVPASTSARRTHLRSVSADPTPSRAATALIAAYSLS